MKGWFLGSRSPKLVTSWVCAAKYPKNTVRAPNTSSTLKRRSIIHSPNRYQVIAIVRSEVEGSALSGAVTPGLAAVVGIEDHAEPDDPAMLVIEKPCLHEGQWHGWESRNRSPRSVALQTQCRAGKAGGKSAVLAIQIDREQRIARGKIEAQLSRHERIGRSIGLLGLMREGPAFSAVRSLNNGPVNTACRPVLRVAERDSIKARKREVQKAGILVSGELMLPLRHQLVLLFLPGIAAVVGCPDAAHLANHPSPVVVQEGDAVVARLLEWQRVVFQLGRENVLQLPLEETLTTVGSAQYQSAIPHHEAV